MIRNCVFVLMAVICTASIAAEEISTNADYVAGEQSTVLLTPEMKALAAQLFGGSAEQLLHAVELNMSKYDLDMQSQTGRRAWHGRLHHEEVSTNGLFKIEVYTNAATGATWRYRLPFKPRDAAAAVKAANAKLATTVTNGIPAALAAARLKRAAEKTTVSNVTVNVEANRE